MNSLSIFRLSNKFTICFAYLSWIRYIFLDVTMNSISSSQFHHDFTIFFENSLWIHYLLHDFTMNFSLIHYRFREITMTSSSASRFSYEFRACFANSVRIHSRFRDQITLNSLSLSLIHLESTNLFRKFRRFCHRACIMYLLCIKSKIHPLSLW